MDETIVSQKIARFFETFPKLEFKKGMYLISPDEKLHTIFYLQGGHVKQVAVSDEGKALTIHIYQPGAHFPLLFLFDTFSNRHYFESMDRCTVHVASRDKTYTFFQMNNDVLLYTTKRLLDALEGMSKRVEVQSFGTARVRVVSTLVYLASHFNQLNAPSSVILQHFTHEEIASITGLTREHVSIEIERLKKEGFITIQDHHIGIPDTIILTSLLPF